MFNNFVLLLGIVLCKMPTLPSFVPKTALSKNPNFCGWNGQPCCWYLILFFPHFYFCSWFPTFILRSAVEVQDRLCRFITWVNTAMAVCCTDCPITSLSFIAWWLHALTFSRYPFVRLKSAFSFHLSEFCRWAESLGNFPKVRKDSSIISNFFYYGNSYSTQTPGQICVDIWSGAMLINLLNS